MKLGIVGLPNVGKSTLFNSLTKAGAESANYPFCTIDPNVGVVPVPDPRLGQLAALYNSAKITPAVIEFVDIAGLVKGASKGEGLGNKFLGNIRECDAIIHVIRCFDDDNIVREGGAKVDPLEDKSVIDTELQLKDLETIESQLTKQKKTAAAGNKDAKTMVTVLEAYKAELEQGKNARGVTFESKEEQKVAHDLFLLTTKPVLYVANVDEASAKTGNEYSKKVEEIAKEEGAECMVIAAKTEEDIVREIQRMAQEPASLESPVGEEEDSSLGDFVADENAEAPGKAADRAMVAQQINLALKSLTPREEKVIRLRFGLDDGRPRTLEEVGRDFGVTRERVRQIEAKAIRKLHSRKCLSLLNGLIE